MTDDQDPLLQWFMRTFTGWQFWPAFVLVLPLVVMLRTLMFAAANLIRFAVWLVSR